MVINSVLLLQLAGCLLLKQKNITVSLGNGATSITLPQSHFSTSLSPLALLFEAAAQASGCLAAELAGEAGAALGRSGFRAAPREAHPDRTAGTAAPLGTLLARGKEEGKLERGIFSVEVEFHTFSEMIFWGLIFFFNSCNSSWRF